MASARALGRRRPLAWAAAAILVALSTIDLVAAAAGDPLRSPISLVWAVIGAAGLLAAARFLTAQCFESRLGMIVVSAATLVLVLLLHTVGAPGLPRDPWTIRDGVLVALSCLLLASWRTTARTSRRL
ncbi:hypothetical protein [Microbacterium sp. BK668]|uniref:hypothetical protein n=1 Tax=Microbacterium sp. BK668 TaxID=2512118 RepID=UPI00105E9230|nr:hypothetical protein [Microbacterium sp. BK668]